MARDLTAVLSGRPTSTVGELTHEIEKQGWQLKRLKFDDQLDEYVGEASSPFNSVKRSGPDEVTALQNLVLYIMRKEFGRTAAQYKAGMWNSDWTHQLQPIAEAYAKAPVFDPKAAGAWQELANDSMARAKHIEQQVKVEVVDAPEPYASVQEMCDDVHRNRHFLVSRANCVHPVWSVEQNIAFRIVHDVLGHCVSGGDFGWQGENLACRAHFPLLTQNAQKALFTECIGQTCYAAYYRSFGPQKVAFLDDFIEPAQAKENDPDHAGVHPQNTIAPAAMPIIEPSGPVGLEDGHVAPHQEGLGLTPVLTRVGASLTDPNAGWDANVQVPAQNAYLAYGDPLGAQQVTDNAAKIDTGWSDLLREDGSPDLDRMRQAIVNAFRVVLLSPRKDLRWNAIHYQDIAGVPSTVDDPKVYWDALEARRRAWNSARGRAEDAHLIYWKPLQKFYQLVKAQRPELEDDEVRRYADEQVYHMRMEAEQRLEADGKQLPPSEMERKVDNEVAKQLDVMTRPKLKDGDVPHYGPQGTFFAAVEHEAAGSQQMDIFTGEDAGLYGAWMGTHLKAVAQVSRHVDEILQAAQEDVHEHDGAGHHFRAKVLSLGVSGVGPKVASFAWLLLQPLTSQLATIDTHMMDLLGHDFEKEMSDRDYFKFERELQAGRDAAGYGHVPLGMFQWGMWDHKRTGPGTHQDHSAMRVLDPVPHDQVNWNQKVAPLHTKGEDWAKMAPEWWQNTQPARDAVASEFDTNVAPSFARGQVPFGEEPVTSRVSVRETPTEDDELHVAVALPDHVRLAISKWCDDVEWEGDHELEDPEDYHVTVLYAPEGHTVENHEWAESFNVTGYPFQVVGVDVFDSQEKPLDAIVLRLECPEFDRWAKWFIARAKERGLEPSEYPGGYKAHVTVAYAENKPTGKAPQLSWRGGPLYVSKPRSMKEPAPHIGKVNGTNLEGIQRETERTAGPFGWGKAKGEWDPSHPWYGSPNPKGLHWPSYHDYETRDPIGLAEGADKLHQLETAYAADKVTPERYEQLHNQISDGLTQRGIEPEWHPVHEAGRTFFRPEKAYVRSPYDLTQKGWRANQNSTIFRSPQDAARAYVPPEKRGVPESIYELHLPGPATLPNPLFNKGFLPTGKHSVAPEGVRKVEPWEISGQDGPSDEWTFSKVAFGYKGFPHWWDKKKPVDRHDAKVLGEYARSEGLSKDALKKFLDDHEEEIAGDDHERERIKDAIVTKFNRLSARQAGAFVPKVFLDGQTGERRETGPEHRSLMHLLGEHYGLSTPELWAADGDLYRVPEDLVDSVE